MGTKRKSTEGGSTNWDPKFDKYFKIHEERIAKGEKLQYSTKE